MCESTVPCELCGTPTQYAATKRCNNCWEVEHRLEQYLKSPQAIKRVFSLIPPLDDWVDKHPDAWDYEAVLRENEATVEWDTPQTWYLYWKHGTIHIGNVNRIIARKAGALFISLWLRGGSASFADKLMDGYIAFLERQEDEALTFLVTWDSDISPSFYLTRYEMMRNQILSHKTVNEIISNLRPQEDDEIIITFKRRKKYEFPTEEKKHGLGKRQ